MIYPFKTGTLAREKDVDNARKNFVEIFNSLYNQNCPIHRFKKKCAKCSCLTVGLQNENEKKIKLCKYFIRLKNI